jgi:hypothetical protein
MQTGENTHALHRILDLTRFISIVLLLLHFYSACYPAARAWGLTFPLLDTLILNLSRNLFFLSGINQPKLASLLLLTISLIGVRGRKSDKLTLPPILFYILTGLLLFFLSSLFLSLSMAETTLAELYISVTTIGYLSILAGGTRMTRLLYLKLGKDIFNENNETFPQEERKLTNEYSINLPAQYKLKGKKRKSWINIINPLPPNATNLELSEIWEHVKQRVSWTVSLWPEYIHEDKKSNYRSVFYEFEGDSTPASCLAYIMYALNTQIRECMVLKPDLMKYHSKLFKVSRASTS